MRRLAGPLAELTADPLGKALAEARWLLGRALIDLEEWDRADAALLDAIREYRRLGKTFEARRARMTRVMLQRSSGAEPRRYLTAAMRVFKSFSETDRLRDPAFYTVCRNNLPLYLVEAGKLWDAWKLWQTIPPDALPAVEARRIGQGAVIAFRMGKPSEAESGLRTAIDLFRDLDMPYDAALALLHLADLLLAIGRLWEGKQILAQATDLFQSCQLRRHVLAAMTQLEEAVRRKLGVREAIRLDLGDLQAFLQRKRHQLFLQLRTYHGRLLGRSSAPRSPKIQVEVLWWNAELSAQASKDVRTQRRFLRNVGKDGEQRHIVRRDLKVTKDHGTPRPHHRCLQIAQVGAVLGLRPLMNSARLGSLDIG